MNNSGLSVDVAEPQLGEAPLLRIALERILLLYDEAIISLKQAAVALSSGGEDKKIECLSAALMAVLELRDGLNHQQDPALSRNLEDLYAFCIHRIYAANNENDRQQIDSVIQVLDMLRGAWRELRADVM